MSCVGEGGSRIGAYKKSRTVRGFDWARISMSFRKDTKTHAWIREWLPFCLRMIRVGPLFFGERKNCTVVREYVQRRIYVNNTLGRNIKVRSLVVDFSRCEASPTRGRNTLVRQGRRSRWRGGAIRSSATTLIDSGMEGFGAMSVPCMPSGPAAVTYSSPFDTRYHLAYNIVRVWPRLTPRPTIEAYVVETDPQ
jgi:hypothetical protein